MHTLGRDKTWRWVQQVGAWWWELWVEWLVAAMWSRLQEVLVSQGRAEQGCLHTGGRGGQSRAAGTRPPQHVLVTHFTAGAPTGGPGAEPTDGHTCTSPLHCRHCTAPVFLQALKREGLVLSLPASDVARKEVFYPVDQRLQMRVDDDLQVRP